MHSRIGIAVGTLFALGLPTPAAAQDTPPLQRPPLAEITGSVRLEFAGRDAAIEEFRARLLSLPVPTRDDTFATGDARIRLDVRTAGVHVAAELATLPYDDGANLTLGDGDGSVVLRQIFAEVEDLPAAGLSLRAGAFDYAWRIRPHGEPFLLDLGNAESFYSGVAARDILQPAGARLAWRAGDFVQVEAAWLTVIENGTSTFDESLVALLLNCPLSERSAIFIGALHVWGEADQAVTTCGGGADTYWGPDRDVEFFGEGWYQSGRLDADITKRAWGAHIGARIVADPWRVEASGAWRSGDDDPADGRDTSFQSYEGQERFRIIESAEFGLDWDTDISSARLSVARDVAETLELRLDAGYFRSMEDTSGFGKDLGIEVDATLNATISAAASAWISVAALLGSDAMEAATADGDDRTGLVTIGIRARW